MALEGQLQAILGADGIVGQLGLTSRQRRRRGHHIGHECAVVGRPTRSHRHRAGAARTVGLEDAVDGGGRVPDTEAGGGIGLRIQIDDQGAQPTMRGRRGEAEGDGGLAHPTLLIDDGDDRHPATVVPRCGRDLRRCDLRRCDRPGNARGAVRC